MSLEPHQRLLAALGMDLPRVTSPQWVRRRPMFIGNADDDEVGVTTSSDGGVW